MASQLKSVQHELWYTLFIISPVTQTTCLQDTTPRGGKGVTVGIGIKREAPLLYYRYIILHYIYILTLTTFKKF